MNADIKIRFLDNLRAQTCYLGIRRCIHVYKLIGYAGVCIVAFCIAIQGLAAFVAALLPLAGAWVSIFFTSAMLQMVTDIADATLDTAVLPMVEAELRPTNDKEESSSECDSRLDVSDA